VPLLEEIGNPVVVNPKAPFREIARRRGWEVVEWKERNRPGAEPDLADEWGSWGG
jgi:phosphoserine phosphatase